MGWSYLGYLGAPSSKWRCLNASTASSWCGGTDFRTLGDGAEGLKWGWQGWWEWWWGGGQVFFWEDVPYGELTYLQKSQSWRWLSFSQGGICYFPRGYVFVVCTKQNWKQQMEMKINIEPVLMHYNMTGPLWRHDVCTLNNIMYVHVPVSVLYKYMSEEVGFLGTCEYALNQNVAMETCRDAQCMYVAASGPQNPYRKRLVGRIITCWWFFLTIPRMPLEKYVLKITEGICQLTDRNIQVDARKFGWKKVNM